MTRATTRTCVLAVLTTTCGAATAATVQVNFATPSLDRWVYPFDSAPGYGPTIRVFSSLGAPKFPGFSFDERDGQGLIGFDTVSLVQGGLGECAYRVTAAVVRIAVATDAAFEYDPTQDPWQSYLLDSNPGNDDADAGRPVELFGAGFRGTWTPETYFEGDADSNPAAPPFGPQITSDVRYVYATDFIGGVSRDVSNNVRDMFDPKAFAIGLASPAVVPGASVPANTDLVFTLNVSDPDVQLYLRRAVNSGRLRLVVSSQQPATSTGGPGAGRYATLYTKENDFGAGRAARLTMTVEVTTLAGDLNGDGRVTTSDLTILLGNFGDSVPSGTGGDVNCDGQVTTSDLTVLLGNFGR